jgi:Bacterial SH3 domain
MPNLIAALSLLCLLAPMAACTLAMQQANAGVASVRFVAVRSGLRLRSGPSQDSPVLRRLPFRSAVRLIAASGDKSETIDGWPGFWRRAEASGAKGYVFSAYLLPILPPIERKSLSDLATAVFNVQLIEKPVIYRFDGASPEPTTLTEFPDDKPSGHYIRSRIHFEQGHQLEEDNYYEGGTALLSLAGWDPVAAFLLLKLSAETDLGSYNQFQASGFRKCDQLFPGGYAETNQMIFVPDGSVELLQTSFLEECD